MPLHRARFTIGRIMAGVAIVAVYFGCVHQVRTMMRPGVPAGGLAAFIQGLSVIVVFVLPPCAAVVGWDKIMNRDP